MENMDQTNRRMFLHMLLKELPYLANVYFQPPEDVCMEYPSIVYKWDGNGEKYADDMVYHSRRNYLLTVIDSNPDSVIPDIFQKNFPYAKLMRTYISNGMNHWVYSLYF